VTQATLKFSTNETYSRIASRAANKTISARQSARAQHGGYGRRMLLSDAITEDAQMLTLDDEFFWLRAANLTAAENIGRWQTELEVAGEEKAKELHALISAAEKSHAPQHGAHRVLEYTKGNIVKMIEAAYREAATEKVELEIGVMKDGDRDNAIVVHNALPIPGR
jgi:hypothetical protein